MKHERLDLTALPADPPQLPPPPQVPDYRPTQRPRTVIVTARGNTAHQLEANARLQGETFFGDVPLTLAPYQAVEDWSLSTDTKWMAQIPVYEQDPA